jgi:hypothetical protein
MSRDALIAYGRVTEELGVRSEMRADHLRIAPHAALSALTWHGTRDGGAFETPLIGVLSHDGRRFHTWEIFDPEQIDAALARFDELTADPARRFENAATRSVDRFERLWRAGDWEGVAELLAPDYRSSDRRKAAQVEVDREHYLAGLRWVLAVAPSGHTSELLATRGDRLALYRALLRGAGGDVGPFEAESLALVELDARGLHVAGAVFDATDLDAATAELDARYAAGEAAAHPRVLAATQAFRAAFAKRDWEAVAAQYAEGVVVHDHRLLGWEPIHGTAAYVESLRTLVELAPDVRIQSDHIALNERGLLWVARWAGTREGGPFDSPWIVVSEHDASGRVLRFDTYDLDQLDAARARFEALLPDPLRIPPNAAARAFDRMAEAFRAWDPAALRTLVSEDFRFEDRRRLALLSGDVELWIQNLEVVRSWPGFRTTRELIGTAGDRIALEHLASSGDPEGNAFEGELLRLAEVDANGKARAWILFEPEDRGLAFAEAQARFVAGEAAGSEAQAAITAFTGSFNRRRNWAAWYRGCFTDDAVLQDHRRLGFGSMSLDEWIESWRVLIELAPDVSADLLRILAWSERGRVSVARQHGTREGGPFESVFVQVFLTRGARIERYEIFDLEDAERALVRFAELSAG